MGDQGMYVKECKSLYNIHWDNFLIPNTHASPLFLCHTLLNASLANRGRESYNNKRANSAFILYKTKTSIGDGTQIMHAIGGERFGAYSSQHFVYSLLGVILSTPLHTEEDV